MYFFVNCGWNRDFAKILIQIEIWKKNWLKLKFLQDGEKFQNFSENWGFSNIMTPISIFPKF